MSSSQSMDRVTDAAVNSSATDASAKLASDAYTANQNLFATPKDYLQTLKQDFSSLLLHDGEGLTKADLEHTARMSPDKQLRDVARVTEIHFDELRVLAANPNRTSDDKLTESDVDTALQLENGDIKGYKNALDQKDLNHGYKTLAITGAIGTLGVLTMKWPLIAGALTTGALAWAISAESEDENYQEAKGRAPQSSYAIRNSMATWSEINGGR